MAYDGPHDTRHFNDGPGADHNRYGPAADFLQPGMPATPDAWHEAVVNEAIERSRMTGSGGARVSRYGNRFDNGFGGYASLYPRSPAPKWPTGEATQQQANDAALAGTDWPKPQEPSQPPVRPMQFPQQDAPPDLEGNLRMYLVVGIVLAALVLAVILVCRLG